MRKPKDYIFLFIKGICMGGVNVFHGISGGTVAFMTGIYEEWIYTLTCFDLEAFQLLKARRFHDLWTKLNSAFLVTLCAGMATGLLILASLVYIAIRTYPIPLYSFFFGLILVSAPLTLRKIGRWNGGTAIGLIAGIFIGYGLTWLSGIPVIDQWWMVILGGFLASAAMVWTGISCSFMLLILGQYGVLAAAVNALDIKNLLIFAVGFIPGLFCHARISRALLVHYHHAGLALLAGLMIGTLNKLWPWREPLEFVTNFKGEQIPAFDRSILPWELMTTTGKDPLVFQAIAMMALGVFIVVLTEKIGARLKTKI